MPYPPLVKYDTVDEYRQHYERKYCRGAISTFDYISVRFRKNRFNHCFFESCKRNQQKDQFSRLRAERIDWIKAALQDPSAELYVGWDKRKRAYDNSRRVAVAVNNYVVVIRLTGQQGAQFVTAYVADSPNTIKRIRNCLKWHQKKQ